MVRYDLAGMMWYMVWPGKHVMVYGMAWRPSLCVWRASHGIWYGLAGIAWYYVMT